MGLEVDAPPAAAEVPDAPACAAPEVLGSPASAVAASAAAAAAAAFASAFFLASWRLISCSSKSRSFFLLQGATLKQTEIFQPMVHHRSVELRDLGF